MKSFIVSTLKFLLVAFLMIVAAFLFNEYPEQAGRIFGVLIMAFTYWRYKVFQNKKLEERRGDK